MKKKKAFDSALIKIRVTRTSKLKFFQVKGTDAEQPLLTHFALSGSRECSCSSKRSVSMEERSSIFQIWPLNASFEFLSVCVMSLCCPLSAPVSENSICRMDPSYSTFIFSGACIQISQNRSLSLLLLFLFPQ